VTFTFDFSAKPHLPLPAYTHLFPLGTLVRLFFDYYAIYVVVRFYYVYALLLIRCVWVIAVAIHRLPDLRLDWFGYCAGCDWNTLVHTFVGFVVCCCCDPFGD